MTAIEQNEYLSFAYSFDEKLRKKLWLEAWEQTYTDRLSQKIISKQRETGRKKSALAQLAFCIDVRSEPFRRHLEKEYRLKRLVLLVSSGCRLQLVNLAVNTVMLPCRSYKNRKIK